MDWTKSIFKSKTLWANVIIVLYSLVTKNVDALKDVHIDSEDMIILGGLVNIVLRRFTSQPVHIVPEATATPVKEAISNTAKKLD